MKCLFLAAGYATRLYPLTQNFPKPLLLVKGKSILDWLIDDLKNIKEIDEYIVVTNHKFASIFSNWANHHQDIKIRIIDDLTSDNDTRLGAVKDLALAINECKINDDLLILAGDNLVDFSFASFVKYFYEKNHTCVMRYQEEDLASIKKRSVIRFDESDLVLEMIEKPEQVTSSWCCPPFYLLHKSDLRYVEAAINEGCQIDAPGSFISFLYRISKVYAFAMPGHRYDIGTLESYQKICSSF